ncbi:hypothetical protein BJ170DRAFT_205793 [Xylariales sp. AK1849]|nr:hypothetical protein BJ170DRAFT_205793 [Xylariales sp. AK1849]
MKRVLSSGSDSSASTYSNLSPSTPVFTGPNTGPMSYYYDANNNNNFESAYPEDYSPTGEDSFCYRAPESSPSEFGGGYYGQGDSYTISQGAASMPPIPISGGDIPRGSSDPIDEIAGLHVCLVPGCDSRMFKRKADLERHYKHRHMPDHQKPQFKCDYQKCGRYNEAFHRMDHFRDHYRDYHNEDLPRKNGKENSEWYKSRIASKKWWRCTKCLRRNQCSSGWDCIECNSRCDSARKHARGF